jgi:hypothetical protein
VTVAYSIRQGMGEAAAGKKKALIKPSHKGKLHRDLGVPEGQPIPASKLAAALRSGSPSVRKEANFARNFGK